MKISLEMKVLIFYCTSLINYLYYIFVYKITFILFFVEFFDMYKSFEPWKIFYLSMTVTPLYFLYNWFDPFSMSCQRPFGQINKLLTHESYT